jgi:N-acylneuraminate cytidylyltransferase
MNTDGSIIALIPARGGSKGVPRKNIKDLAGKPLIAYSIEAALQSGLIDRVVVSTEDEEIAETARSYGAEAPFMRPTELAQDDSPEWLVWQHAIKQLNKEDRDSQVGVLVCVSPTSPLRSVEDLDACILALTTSDVDMVITVTPAARSPYFNMVAINDSGLAELLIPPKGCVYRRQDVPAAFDVTTVAYAARPAFVLNANSMFEGKVKAVIIPPERALDIDTELDFRIAEVMLGLSSDEEFSLNNGPKRVSSQ